VQGPLKASRILGATVIVRVFLQKKKLPDPVTIGVDLERMNNVGDLQGGLLTG